jgi:hypothetical protein
MLTVLARLTLKKCEIKSLLSYFRGSVVLHTLQNSRTDQMKCTVNQPGQPINAKCGIAEC